MELRPVQGRPFDRAGEALAVGDGAEDVVCAIGHGRERVHEVERLVAG
jgi:hypothetical protein